VLGANGKVVQVHYKVCTQIGGIKKVRFLKLIIYGNMLDVAKPSIYVKC